MSGDASVTVARISAGTGAITMEDKPETSPDDMLTGPEVARLLGIAAVTWRGYVKRGLAPKADDPGVGHPARRTPRWRVETVRQYRATRKGAGFRSDLKDAQ